MHRALVSLACGLVLLATGCTDASHPGPADTHVPRPTGPSASATTSTPVPRGTALQALERIPVKGRAPKTGYARERFGTAWYDLDRNGCDTRNDVLRRDLTEVVIRPGTYDCVVLAGTLHDPYSGAVITFVRGVDTSYEVQIDHVVALSDAWQKGAQQLSAERRRELANDPLNLLAVSGRLNSQKGDGDAATWLPPAKAYRPAYVARQIAVKVRYGLWVTAAERAAMVRILAARPGTPLPQ